MDFSIKLNSEQFTKGLDEKRDRFSQALAVSRNMIASMMKEAVTADVTAAGRFPGDAVSVTVEGDTIRTVIDLPGASIFETGGTISGKPLLWIPFSNSDAAGIQAKDYGDQLFSVNKLDGGKPLLFSIRDRQPKYFGTPSVKIPKKFHVADIERRIMAVYADIFERALGGANG